MELKLYETKTLLEIINLIKLINLRAGAAKQQQRETATVTANSMNSCEYSARLSVGAPPESTCRFVFTIFRFNFGLFYCITDKIALNRSSQRKLFMGSSSLLLSVEDIIRFVCSLDWRKAKTNWGK